MKLYLNITTEDGELLERVEIEVADDMTRPIGGADQSWVIIHEVESWARVVITRARNAKAEADLLAFDDATTVRPDGPETAEGGLIGQQPY